jgi:putative ABC transport system ATP-binding protein
MSGPTETSAMGPLVEFRQVSRNFKKGKDSITIFDKLDLSIAKGDFVAVMGPSGSGKTTLLNLLGGIDRANSGELQIAEHRIDLMSESDLTRWRGSHVGFIFQFYNLMPMLTAAQNVELPLLLTDLNRRERRVQVESALKIVDLGHRGNHRPREMSGGEQQRVAIARAIIADPDLLLCDEPTGDLDRKTADDILNTLRLLNTEHGKTIVMVTHDPEAARYANHTLRLNKGQFFGDEPAK